MRKKRPVAASVLAQAQSKAASQKLTLLRKDGHALSRVGRTSIAGKEKPNLAVVLVGRHTPERYDLTFMLPFENLWEPFAEGFRLWALNKKKSTRYVGKCEIQTGFFLFLSESHPSTITLEQLDGALFTAFAKWVNERGGALATRAAFMKSVRSILRALRAVPRWAQAAEHAKDEIPRNMWPGRAKKSVPRERLDLDHFAAIMMAAEQEIRVIADRWKEGIALLGEGRKRLEADSRNYADLATCLAAIESLYKGAIPSLNVIRAADKALQIAIQYRFTQARITGFLYPSARDLVPFALLIAGITAFNPDTVLGLTWDRILEIDRLGLPAVGFLGPKARAGDDPVVVLAGGPSKTVDARFIVDFLREFTGRLRSPALLSHAERIFIFQASRHSKAVKSFEHNTGNLSSDETWKTALASFINTNKLLRFTLVQIRTTILDEVHRATGDIVQAQAVARHKSTKTVWTHYTSDGTRRLYKERIGEMLLLRERWVESLGTIDPRRSPISHDKGAATPGFLCLDPFDSPRLNQRKGRLCTAYGECCSCPLAAVNANDVTTAAYLQALKRAIYAAQGRISPEGWLTRWAPTLDDLDSLLAQIPPAIRAESGHIHLSLPPVG